MMAGYLGKRLLDGGAVVVSAPLWVPLLGLVAGYVWATLGRPVFFRQTRAGRDGKPFELIKFRTMHDRRDGQGQLLPDAARLPRAGRWLRASSLDELPELLHVLRGEMSLVGPRPLPMAYVGRYSPFQARRLECLPGLTGLAQVSGRNALGWEERFALDVDYVDGQSLAMDLKILARTVRAVLSRRGIAAPGAATMAEFRGSEAAPSGFQATPADPAPVRKSES